MTGLNTRRAGLGLSLLLTAWLAGCAGVSAITSQVSSYGQWPAGRQPGLYTFERLPSQQSRVEWQDKLEAAAQPALAAAGFELAKEAGQADLTVQVASQVQTDPRPRYDPFWGPYGPWGRGGVGGWWGGRGRGGLSMSFAVEPPHVQTQVDVLIRDRRNNQVLYETHAKLDHVGAADDRLLPYLFEAALKDFPHQAVSPRAVTIEIPPEDR